MKKKIVDDLETLAGRIVVVALAFAQHKVPYRPEKLEYNSGHQIAKSYIKYCKNLDNEIFQKYKENLEERFKNKFPTEAIPLPSEDAKVREPDIDDLKAYDAFKMYIAKINNSSFRITEEGKLLFDEFIEREDGENETELKSLDEYY